VSTAGACGLDSRSLRTFPARHQCQGTVVPAIRWVTVQGAGSVHRVLLDSDDPSTLRITTETGLRLEFEKALPYGPDDPHFVGMLVRAVGGQVRVEQQVLLLAASELPRFLRGLYEDFRGWAGERTWRSLESELRVIARHDGHVHLNWEITDRPYDEARWTFSIATRHGAGEDVRRLADAFDTLLGL
jgi:hypothetical protein